MQLPQLSPERQEQLLDAFLKPVSWLNAQLIKRTGGRIGANLPRGITICVLTTTGRKTGQQREVSLLYFMDGSDVILIASKGGMPHHPHWYLNVRDNPRVTIRIGTAVRNYTARTATADEKARLWPRAVATYGGYQSYQNRTDRDIPVVICSPA